VSVRCQITTGGNELPAIDKEGLLRLSVGYYGAPDIRSASQILDRLGNAFTQELRRSGEAYQLDITKIEIGSLRAFLDIAGNLLELYEQRETLSRFTAVLVASYQSVIGTNVVEIIPAMRSFLSAISGPVASGRASHAKVHVVGDNNNVFYIEKADAELLQMFLTPPRRVEPPRIRRAATAAQLRAEVDLDEVVDLPADEVLRKRVRILKKTDAKLHYFDGRWYASPAGLRGVLLPLAAESPVVPHLDKEGDYIASGSILREGDALSSFHADNARNLA
jgi:hypothetical protein